MRRHYARTTIAALALTALATSADGQELPRRANIEGTVGFMNGVPGPPEQGLGPYASVTLRLAPSPSYRSVLLGVGYGIVFGEQSANYDGFRYRYAPETVMLHLGYEAPLGERRRFAMDVQWNPAMSRVKRIGARPAWLPADEPFEWTYSTVSVGLRYNLSGSRGPVVAVNGRTYLSILTPLMLASGMSPMFVVGLSARPR